METYKQINLNDYVQTGEGGTSLTYTHKSRPALAKLFNPGREAEQAEHEFLMAQAVFQMGIPTPQPLQLITDGKRQGVEYELIAHKRSLTRIISEEPNRLEDVSLTFARMARQLHATKADTKRLPSVKDALRRFDQQKDLVSQEYKERALNFLDKAPDADTCVHGDMHIGNVITDGQRSDFLLHITPETLKAHWDIFLPAYLGTTDSAAIDDYTKQLMPFYAVRVPYMLDVLTQGRLPQEAFKPLSQLIR